MAVFSRLVPTLITCYLVQTAGALIFIPFQNGLFYDITGTIGFLTSTFVSLFYESIKEGNPLTSILETLSTRQLLLNGALVIWATRLGYNLLSRSIELGGNSRFTEIKQRPIRFAMVVFMQATWTFSVGLPVYLANTLCTLPQSPIQPQDYIPLALLTSSFLLETIAHQRKSRWRDRRQKGKNVKHGNRLWNWSHHPNYIGDLGVCLGIWALSTSALQHSSHPRLAPAVAAVSPLITWHLLTKGSGITLLESHVKKTLGDDPRYRENIRRVPSIWPWYTRS